MQRFNDPAMAPLKEPFREIMEGRLELSTLKRDPKGPLPTEDVLKARSSVVTVLNFYEEVAILVLTKGADEERLRRFFKSLVCDGYAKLEDWIRHERNIANRQEYYKELQELADRWSAKN